MGDVFFSDSELAELRRGHVGSPDADIRDLTWYAARKIPLFFFGAGGFGRGLAAAFVAQGGVLAGFLDNNPVLWDGVEVPGLPHPLPVYNPATALARVRAVPGALVVLSASPADAQVEMLAQAEQLGIEVEVFSPPCWPSAEAADDPGPRAVYAMLDDDRSREVYRLLIRKRSGYDSSVAMPFEPNQYFPDFMPRDCYRFFLDVGALNGDTFRRYLERFGNDFAGYYAVEPNPVNFRLFHPGPAEHPNLKLFNVAASDKAGVIHMTDNHSASHVVEGGGIEVPSDTLDHMLAGAPVTIIKMDIETWEPAALRGAAHIIRAQRPALAISIYHRFTHLWEVPLLLRRLNPEYKLRVRHHSRFVTETICYALP